MDEVELSSALMRIELFEGLEYGQIEKIMASAEERVLAPGDVVCEAQTIDDRLTVFLEGKLHIESGDGVLLSDVTQVRVLGEMGMLLGKARSSRVLAATETKILELTGEALQELVEEDPEVAQRMLTNLCSLLYSRMFDVNQEIEELRTERDALRARVAELTAGA